MKTQKQLKNVAAKVGSFDFGRSFADQVSAKMAYFNKAANEICLQYPFSFEHAAAIIDRHEDAFTLNRVMGMSPAENVADLFKNELTAVYND